MPKEPLKNFRKISWTDSKENERVGLLTMYAFDAESISCEMIRAVEVAVKGDSG